MTDISIDEGQTKEIIPSDQSDLVYLVEVDGATIRIGHNERYARQGSRIKAGDRVKINPFGRRLFAHAEDGDARLILDHANSEISYQARAEIGDVSRIESVTEIQNQESIETRLDSTISEIQTAISEVQSVVTEIQNSNQQLGDANTNLTDAIAELNTANDSLGSINTTLGDIDLKLSNIQTAIADVETSVDNVNTELTTQTPILEDIRDNTGA